MDDIYRCVSMVFGLHSTALCEPSFQPSGTSLIPIWRLSSAEGQGFAERRDWHDDTGRVGWLRCQASDSLDSKSIDETAAAEEELDRRCFHIDIVDSLC